MEMGQRIDRTILLVVAVRVPLSRAPQHGCVQENGSITLYDGEESKPGER